MNNLLTNFYSLAFLAGQIKINLYTMKSAIENDVYLNRIESNDNFVNQIPYSKAIRAICSNNLIIRYCSFLDEYKKFNPKNIEPEFSDRVKKVLLKNKYGINRIKKWKDLYNYRNQIIAHNFDIKKKSVLNLKEVKTYIIPDTLQEKIIIHSIIEKICQNISSEFVEIRENIDLDFSLDKKIKIEKCNNLDFKKEIKLIHKNM